MRQLDIQYSSSQFEANTVRKLHSDNIDTDKASKLLFLFLLYCIPAQVCRKAIEMIVKWDSLPINEAIEYTLEIQKEINL